MNKDNNYFNSFRQTTFFPYVPQNIYSLYIHYADRNNYNQLEAAVRAQQGGAPIPPPIPQPQPTPTPIPIPPPPPPSHSVSQPTMYIQNQIVFDHLGKWSIVVIPDPFGKLIPYLVFIFGANIPPMPPYYIESINFAYVSSGFVQFYTYPMYLILAILP